MGVFHLGGMTLHSLASKPETCCYPAETKEAPAGLKGRVDNRVEDCIFCGICARKCPSDSITVDRQAGTWSFDGFSCIQCSSCVRECPKQCLIMEPEYTSPATAKKQVQYVVQR